MWVGMHIVIYTGERRKKDRGRSLIKNRSMRDGEDFCGKELDSIVRDTKGLKVNVI
jgi:hypothetical protein